MLLDGIILTYKRGLTKDMAWGMMCLRSLKNFLHSPITSEICDFFVPIKFNLDIGYLFMGRKVWKYPIPHAVSVAVFQLPIRPFGAFYQLKKVIHYVKRNPNFQF